MSDGKEGLRGPGACVLNAWPFQRGQDGLGPRGDVVPTQIVGLFSYQ